MKPEVKAELDKIAKANRQGLLVPREIVKAASNPRSALHTHFTWDNDKAASSYREIEARRLIQIYVRYEPQLDRKVRAFVSIPTDRVEGNGYRSTSEVINNPIWLQQLEEEVLNKLKSLQLKHQHLTRFDALWPRLESVVVEYMTEARSALRESA